MAIPIVMMVNRLFPALCVVLLSACGSAAMLASDCIRDGLLSGEGCSARTAPPGDFVAAQPTYDDEELESEDTEAPQRSLETVERVAPEPSPSADPADPEEPPPPIAGDPRFPACDATGCMCVPGSCEEGACDTATGACLYTFEFVVAHPSDDAVQEGLFLNDDDDILEIDADEIAWFRFTGVVLPEEALLEDVRLQLFHVGDGSSDTSFFSYLQFERNTHAAPFAGAPPLLRDCWTSEAEWQAAPSSRSWIESPDLTTQLNEVRALGGLEGSGASVVLSLMLDPFIGILTGNELWALSSTGEEDDCVALGCAPRLVGRYRVPYSAP